MSGFVGYVGGQLVIEKDDRLVLSTGDTLVQFLTSEQTFSRNCVFPDVPKGEGYVYNFDVDYSALAESYGYVFNNASCVLAKPQEWENQITLGAIPDGADIFWGKALLNRTVGPSHSWGVESLTPRIRMNDYIQITGSFLLEQVRGLSRALSVFISGDNLIVDLQQSCGPAAGNFGNWGQTMAPEADRRGGNVSAPSGAGKYVHTAHNGFTGSGTVDDYSNTFPVPTLVTIAAQYQNGGVNEAPYSDPTDYGVTYALTVKGRFGRRS
ncbi:hypothetical protein [Devosia ginsengisoli]|uniref:Uncharacterized protein n=1 Tax=Devosia ginsengisoli TaxID=400770 RepID=A0A5B8LSP2_9HYPH|nr:hypothetical protein [Devosia ginsengisoli]QDZ10512.1 hypothetical protein FPZ08_06965 [Devosia ginsengisoli]